MLMNELKMDIIAICNQTKNGNCAPFVKTIINNININNLSIL